ncbi:MULTISPECIES: hypothetical protein [Sphingomonadales]|uniref:Uncharacterized protein n=2 Tax=Edaphosphingomonas TaxID=3423724 RepID=A0A2T4I6T4_9SPHN|nr:MULTISPECIES: hypothetical protein [Sphingomonas]AGH48364.1 hypothetical protein G432_03185 [Sphingomonas sp. MM-1]MDX3883549.1 hypothetical protein [Sphingomonas sp.]OHT20836.1 hypothetical protein BHE75_02839 [Sphingomonas haloaromaticamans]PTD26329.1 hypothetical protein CV103_03825 [Sphingomonas fennica]
MTEPTFWLAIAFTGLAGLLILTQAALKGWRGWLDLRRLEIDNRREEQAHASAPSPASRIELADLKERVRKLEAIAAGVDL